MTALVLSETDVARELDRAIDRGELATYGALLFFHNAGMPLIRCIAPGCHTVIPNVEPFDPWCSVACAQAVAPRRRLARVA